MTCRHYRFQIPQEDADELRAGDPEPCPVCDRLPRRNAQVLWSPKLTPTEKSAPLGKLHDWLTNLFHHSTSPAKAGHNSPASAVSSC